ncbi:hypothetical protein [Hymenobacter latericus]|uniref:hypothetical protein n=1 Tax=Hymenobacter sp. YIM 151858-1 TaxID=2987688 RepID=UPI00222667DD|nr:hypothetical protein [Hymenobacter sp. YIM 151858-1]UYZ60077.1 hypothetical protein OIS50_04575 [Hymenobacter sp. YIM 151858-1]
MPTTPDPVNLEALCPDCKGSGGVEVGEHEYATCPCVKQPTNPNRPDSMSQEELQAAQNIAESLFAPYTSAWHNQTQTLTDCEGDEVMSDTYPCRHSEIPDLHRTPTIQDDIREALNTYPALVEALTAATQRAQAAEEAYTQLRLQVTDALRDMMLDDSAIYRHESDAKAARAFNQHIEQVARGLDIDLDEA